MKASLVREELQRFFNAQIQATDSEKKLRLSLRMR